MADTTTTTSEAPPVEVNPATPPLDKVGFSGLNRFGGLVSEEYLPELKGIRKVDVYSRMRADGMIQAVLTAIKDPIISGTWTVVSGGKQARARKAADMIGDQLGIPDGPTGLDSAWEQFLENCLTCLDYGWQLFAENWSLKGSQVVLDELLHIHPRSIMLSPHPWEFDDQGHVTGCWQTGYRGKDGTGWVREFIPSSRLFHLVNKPYFGNPEGEGLLRAPYKHWYLKDHYYRCEGIAHLRGSAGFPVYSYPPGTPETIKNGIETMLQGVCVSENGYALIPNTHKMENFDLQVKADQLGGSIRHQNEMIAVAILAKFLFLGSGVGAGAGALASEDVDFFHKKLAKHAGLLAAQITRGPAAKIVYYNFPRLDPDLYPQVKCSVSRLSVAAFADSVRKLLGKQPALKWSNRDQAALRERIELPAMEDPEAPLPPPDTGGAGSQPGDGADRGPAVPANPASAEDTGRQE